MRKSQEHWTNRMLDAALGYSVVILGFLCFLLALALVGAIVRFIAGAGA